MTLQMEGNLEAENQPFNAGENLRVWAHNLDTLRMAVFPNPILMPSSVPLGLVKVLFLPHFELDIALFQ